MECEICGKRTVAVKEIELDGNSLIVCTGCSTYGKEKEKVAKPFGASLFVKNNEAYQGRKEFDLGLEISDDFGKRVRRAREKKGLSVKELAMKIFEKDSLIHRIENQEIKPSDKLIGKLEKQLGIELKSKTE